MRGGADSCRSMDAQAEVARSVQERLRGVEAHSNSELHAVRPLDGGEPALEVHRGRHRIRGAVEGREVRVALRVDDVAIVVGTGINDQATVLRSDSTVFG